jgi:hypothetical protein
MWSWWEKTDPSRRAGIAGTIGDGSPVQQPDLVARDLQEEEEEGEDEFVVGGSVNHGTNKIQTYCPRTLKELDDMIAAAKVALWGGQESDESSDDYFSTQSENQQEDNADDDDDDSTSTTSSSNVRAGGDTFVQRDHPPIMASSTSTTSRVDIIDNELRTSLTTRLKHKMILVGPTSDTLTPVVNISHQHDSLGNSKQNVVFALHWKLGDIKYEPWWDEGEEKVDNDNGGQYGTRNISLLPIKQQRQHEQQYLGGKLQGYLFWSFCCNALEKCL